MRIGIAGLGTIGLSLSEYLSQKGFDIIAYNYRALEEKKNQILKNLQSRVKAERISGSSFIDGILSRISFTADLSVLSGADIILECIKEDYDSKRALIDKLFSLVEPGTIIASNTSSLVLERLCGSSDLHRFCGIHFFNPPTKMKLIETAFLRENSEITRNNVRDFLGRLDDKKIVELPPLQGYVVNKLLFQYINAAMNLASAENIPIKNIDDAMKYGTNASMGPFELADYVGLDVTFQILEELFESTGNTAYKPATLLVSLVKEGRLGRKSGEGFYKYKK